MRQPADHVNRIACFTLDVVYAVEKTPISLGHPDMGTVLNRVGFHSGLVVTTVVGKCSLSVGNLLLPQAPASQVA